MDGPAATLALVLRKPTPTPPSFSLLQLMTLAEKSQGSADTAKLKNVEELGRGGMYVGGRMLITPGGSILEEGARGGGISVLTGILIGVQVSASSQSEAEARHAASGGPGGPQLLAQRQASCHHVPVAIEDQHSAATLLATERTADCHVCISGGTKQRCKWLRHQRWREERR